MKHINPQTRKAKIIGVAALVLVLPAILFLIKTSQDIRQRASGTVSVASTIPAGNRMIGEEFYTDITVNTQGNNVSAFDMSVQYNASVLTAKGVIASSPFTLVKGEISTPGVVRIVAIAKPPVNGTVTVGKIAFQAKAAGNSNLSYNNIQIAALGSGATNLSSGQTPTTITVASGPSATPTPVSSTCPGGLTNCADSAGSNYSCSGSKTYIGNITYDTWCKNNGGAGSKEYCWKCIGAPTPTTAPMAPCPGGFSNCANDSGSNYSCAGAKDYLGNTSYDNWCKNNGGAGSKEYCYRCIAPTATPTPVMCPGGLTNCANDSGSNYSCSGSKTYIGNTTYDTWCKNNGGAGSKEYCWRCTQPS